LAVMAFQPCFLIELGFIDNPKDAASLTDPQKRLDACAAIAELL
jgi:N-acetylmuramoyl-L-alanine amidase